jgi:hypothetical protein
MEVFLEFLVEKLGLLWALCPSEAVMFAMAFAWKSPLPQRGWLRRVGQTKKEI